MYETRTHGGVTGKAGDSLPMYISGLVVAYLFFLAVGPIDTALDRLVFRRPDYRETLANITSGIAKGASTVGYRDRKDRY